MFRPAVAAALLLFLSAYAHAADPVVAVQVTETVVTISNVTPGGSAVLFSCSRGLRQGRIYVKPQAIVLKDDDGNGVVQHTPLEPVPLRSVWVAVDSTNGSIASAAHPRFPLRVTPIAADAFKKDAENEIHALAHDVPRLLLLVVRPKKGAWLLRGFDGEVGDRDGVNGRLTLAFEDAKVVDGKDNAPKHLAKDDVVIGIGPSHLDVFTATIGK